MIVKTSLFWFFGAVDLRLLDLDTRSGDWAALGGVCMISRGGVKRSLGGSYGGKGVADRLRADTCSRDGSRRGGM